MLQRKIEERLDQCQGRKRMRRYYLLGALALLAIIGCDTQKANTSSFHSDNMDLSIRPMIRKYVRSFTNVIVDQSDTVKLRDDLGILTCTLLEEDDWCKYAEAHRVSPDSVDFSQHIPSGIVYHEDHNPKYCYDMTIVFHGKKDYAEAVKALELLGWVQLDTTTVDAYELIIIDSTKRIPYDGRNWNYWGGARSLREQGIPVYGMEGEWNNWPIPWPKTVEIDELKAHLEKYGLSLRPSGQKMTMIEITDKKRE